MSNKTSSANVTESRESVYDWVRILATLFVVVGHSAYVTMSVQYGGIDFSERVNEWSSVYYNSPIFNFFGRMAGWVYQFHMPLFSILSGAVLRLKPIVGIDEFCKRKFKRLVIPYYLGGLLFMIPMKYLGGFIQQRICSLHFTISGLGPILGIYGFCWLFFGVW